MTAIELEDLAPAPRTGIISRLRQILAAMTYRLRQRQTLDRLSALDQRLLLDIGVDPSDVEDALNGDSSTFWLKAHLRPDLR